MKSAINTNPLYNLARRNQRASLYPMGQADQEEVNDRKLGMKPLRRYARQQLQPVMPTWAQPNRALAATA